MLLVNLFVTQFLFICVILNLNLFCFVKFLNYKIYYFLNRSLHRFLKIGRVTPYCHSKSHFARNFLANHIPKLMIYSKLPFIQF